jgi:hypothetical protein
MERVFPYNTQMGVGTTFFFDLPLEEMRAAAN